MIREDKSYLTKSDNLAIENGFAVLDIHSIRISREAYTEEEKKENSKLASILSDAEWVKSCDKNTKIIASKVEPLIDALSKKFIIYQYKDDNIKYNSKWDLFFWCNVNDNGVDYSYITLTTNSHQKTLEERFQDVKQVTEYLKEIGFDGVDVAIQYTAKYDKEKINQTATIYFEKIKNVFVHCFGIDGRIKDKGIDNDGNKCYGFYRKGARTHYRNVSSKDMAIMSLA